MLFEVFNSSMSLIKSDNTQKTLFSADCQYIARESISYNASMAIYIANEVFSYANLSTTTSCNIVWAMIFLFLFSFFTNKNTQSPIFSSSQIWLLVIKIKLSIAILLFVAWFIHVSLFDPMSLFS